MTLPAVLVLLCAQIASEVGAPAQLSPFPSIDWAARQTAQPSNQSSESVLLPTTEQQLQPQSAQPSTAPSQSTSPQVQFSLTGYAGRPGHSEFVDPQSPSQSPLPLSTSIIAVSQASPGLTLENSSALPPPLTEMTFGSALDAVDVVDADLAAPLSLQPSPATYANNSWRASAGRPLRRWFGRQMSSDFGLAHERVKFAPLVTENALGVPNVGLRMRYNRGASSPDRLEYLWARAGKGPAAESRLDVLDTVLRTEVGNTRGVLISEISMRSLDPERAPNTTGFGDMVVGGKAVVYDGACTKLSSIFLTYLKTGPVDRGLGTGHVSLEPGLLGMHQWSERTFLHAAIQYRLPIAGTPGFAGDVLTTSWAASTVWQDRDDFAWIPLLEFQTHSFLFGSQTESDGTVSRVNGTTALDILPGSRFAFSRSALGAMELGVSGGFRCSDADWFDSRMMFDVRWLR